MFMQIVNEESGVLTFEWVLLVTLVVIGLVAGMSTVRDTTNSEINDLATVTMALEQSYGVHKISGQVAGSLDHNATILTVTASSTDMSHQNGKVTPPTLRAIDND